MELVSAVWLSFTVVLADELPHVVSLPHPLLAGASPHPLLTGAFPHPLVLVVSTAWPLVVGTESPQPADELVSSFPQVGISPQPELFGLSEVDVVSLSPQSGEGARLTPQPSVAPPQPLELLSTALGIGAEFLDDG